MQKIQEIIVEPNQVYVGSIFKLKVKAIRYMTCEEMETKTCEEAEQYTCEEVGDE